MTSAGDSVAASDDRRGYFVVLEGLSCVGKTTMAPLVADRLGAEFLPTLLEEFEPVRRRIDTAGSATARLHFWLMANYAAANRIRGLLTDGTSVVIESYLYRTLATHGAMGVRALPEIDWVAAACPDLAIWLTLSEPARQARLRHRQTLHGLSRWSQLIEANVPESIRIYETFDMVQVDATGLMPGQVADAIAAHVAELGSPVIRSTTDQSA